MPRLNQIKASAGSGKTHVLTGKYIECLTGCTKIHGSRSTACILGKTRNVPSQEAAACAAGEILAITFTNAAATEMRDRILKRLKEAALGIGNAPGNLTPAEARVWLNALLHDMGALNIRTIDSLLHMVVRTSAMLLGINPDFEPAFSVEDPIAPYLELLFEKAKTDEALENKLRQACNALLVYGKSTGFLAGSKITDRLNRVMDQCILNVFSDLSDFSDLEKRYGEQEKDAIRAACELLKTAASAGMAWKKKAIEAVQNNADGDFKTYSEYAKKDNPAPLFLAKSHPTPDVCAAYAIYKADMAQLMTHRDLYRKALELSAFISIAKIVAAAFTSNLDTEGQLPSILIPQKAALALQDGRGVSDALCRLGSRLTHYLIDEFQDTSQEQWHALKPLVHEAVSRGGSFTWVGDVKQSIYGWRGGDSTLFDSVGNEPELVKVAGRPKPDHLGKNWRSQKCIVEHTNAFFSALGDLNFARQVMDLALPEGIPQAQAMEAATRLRDAFADACQDCAKDEAGGGYVRGEYLCAKNSDELDKLVCERLAALLMDELHSRRPWSDIYVLVRSATQARTVARALIDCGIPVVSEDSLILAEHPLIIQTVAFLAFLAVPDDDIAFWTVLCGAIFLEHPAAACIDWQKLHDWAAARKGATLWEAFAKDYPEIWKKVFAPFYNQAGLLTPYDLVMEWFGRMDVGRRFARDETMLRRFMEIVQKAEEKGNASIAAFLEFWGKKGESEKAPMPEHMNAVRIMTIHKAKGLEAPVIILPWTHFSLDISKDITVVDYDGLKMAVPGNMSQAGDIYHQACINQALEMLNLFYVAMTRAREELYFFHTSNEKSKNTIEPIIELLLGQAGFQPPYSMGAPASPHKDILSFQGDAEDAQAHQTFAAAPLDDGWNPMQWLPRLKIFQNDLDSKDLTPKARGIFLHYCLECLQFGGDMETAARTAFNLGLLHSGVFVPENDDLRLELLDSLLWFAKIPQAAHWLNKGWPEQSMLDGSGEMLRADLIVPCANGYLVIDYKSGTPEPEHIKQIKRYMDCLGQSGAFAGEINGLLIYLGKKGFQLVTKDEVSPFLRDCPEFF